MTSKFKDQTESTQPSSSGESTAALVPPSEPSVRTDNTPVSTQPIRKSSTDISSVEAKSATTPTTVLSKDLPENTKVNADMAKAALRQLETAGLIRRFRVLSPDGTTVTKVRIEFEMSIWTTELDLK